MTSGLNPIAAIAMLPENVLSFTVSFEAASRLMAPPPPMSKPKAWLSVNMLWLPEGKGAVSWLAWDPSDESRLAIARDNGDIPIWNLAHIDQALAELGLGFPTRLPETETVEN